MKDFLTSIARTHLALIASTALVLALAVVPDESRSLDAGEAEANALEEVTRDLRAIEEAEPKGSFENADDTARIQRIASSYSTNFRTDSGFIYQGPLAYRPVGSESSVREILIAIADPPLRYQLAPSDQDVRAAFDAVTGQGRHTKRLSCRTDEFDPKTAYACDTLPKEMTLVSIRVDALAESPPSHNEGQLSSINRAPRPQARMILSFSPSDKHALTADAVLSYEYQFSYSKPKFVGDSIKYNDVRTSLIRRGVLREHVPKYVIVERACTVIATSGFISRELFGLNDPLSHEQAAIECSRDGDAFRELKARHDEVDSLTPWLAARHFHEKAATARQRFSFLGQTVDERIVSYGGSLVVAAISWFLLGEVTALRLALVKFRVLGAISLSVNEIVPAWLGMQSNTSSRLFALFSVFVFPVTALSIAWLQTDNDFDLGQLINVCGILTTALCCALSLMQLRRLRKELRLIFDEVRLSKRAERRAEIRKKLAERQEKRDAKQAYDNT